MPINKTIVLQSFRTSDVPRWITYCMNSVERWAASNDWEYRFLDDRFFDFAPPAVKDRCGENIYALTDVCRLQWQATLLEREYQRAIWVDADVLVFAPEKLTIPASYTHAFAHELFLRVNGAGSYTPYEGINNAVMLFMQGDPILKIYLDMCLDYLYALPPGPVPRMALGPTLLSNLVKSHTLQVLHGVGLFTPAIMRQIGAGGGQLPREYLKRSPMPLGAANLCHFQRNVTAPNERVYFDLGYERAVARLLDTAGEVLKGV